MSPNPQDPFGMNQQMGRGPPQRNASMNEAEVDNAGDVFSFPAVPNEDNLLGVNKPLPKQLWEAKKSAGSRPYPDLMQNLRLDMMTMQSGSVNQSLPCLLKLARSRPYPGQMVDLHLDPSMKC